MQRKIRATGHPGSYHFLHQWLWPFLNQSAESFDGAIILDSISKFNTEVNSQYLPGGFDEVRGGVKEELSYIELVT